MQQEIVRRKLFDRNIEIPAFINTLERIFQIETFDGETLLCNLRTAKELINFQQCKRIRHYWNHKFVLIGKKEVKEMPL